MRLRGTLTESEKSSWVLVDYEVTEEAFEVEVGGKDGAAFIPALFHSCPAKCPKEHRGKGYHCPGSAPHRLKTNVTHVTGLGLDCDHLSEERYRVALERLAASGLQFWAWETHSHAPPTDCRFRVLIPFAEPFPIASSDDWTERVRPALLAQIGMTEFVDESTKDPCRVYFLPRKASAELERESVFVPGDPLRITLPPHHSSVPILALPSITPHPSGRPIDLAHIRERLLAVQNGRVAALCKALARGESLTPPPEKRRPGQLDRNNAWLEVTAVLSMICEGWEDPAVVLEGIAKESFATMVAESPDDHTSWETIEDMFLRAMASAPGKKAETAAREKAEMSAFFSRSLKKSLESPAPRAVAEAPDEERDEDGLTKAELAEFKRDLQVTYLKGGGTCISSCAANLELMLRLDPAWRGVFRFNELTLYIEMHGGPLLPKGEMRPLRDLDECGVADWFSRRHNMRMADNIFFSRIFYVARQNAYNPLKDYLNGLQWDGVSRLETLLETYFNAETIDASGRDITQHIRTLSKRWAVSLAARGLTPGCQMETVLELESEEQGRRKSQALRALGGPFFTDSHIDIANKDSYALCSKYLIVELGELETWRRSEATAQKGFLSRQYDEYRPPYGRNHVKVPRSCVFVGTTNKNDYLNDDTGNRRHWPVTVREIDIEGIKRDRDQIFAEAVVLFRAGVQWHLTKEEEVEAKIQAEARMAPDEVAEAIERWALHKEPAERPEFVTTYQVFRDILSWPVGQRGAQMQVGAALRKLGFKKRRRIADGVQVWAYLLPQNLREAGRVRRGRMLQSIPGGLEDMPTAQA